MSSFDTSRDLLGVLKGTSGDSKPGAQEAYLQEQAASYASRISGVVADFQSRSTNKRFIYDGVAKEFEAFPKTPATRDMIYSTLEGLHPSGSSAYRDEVRSGLDARLGSVPNDWRREKLLSDELANGPAWLSADYGSMLAGLTAKSATQETVKSTQAYAHELDNDLGMLLGYGEALNVDIPVDVHVQDIVNIESLDLRSKRQVRQGRVGIMEGMTFRPGSEIGLEAGDAVAGGNPTQNAFVADNAYGVATKRVSKALGDQVLKVDADRRVANMKAINDLGEGRIPRSGWMTTVLSLSETDKPGLHLEAGLRQAVKGTFISGQVKTATQAVPNILSTIIEADRYYKGETSGLPASSFSTQPPQADVSVGFPKESY